MNLADMRKAVRVDLDDVAEVIWNTDSLDRAVQRAVWDLSRRIPLEKTMSVKIDWSVVDEAVTTIKDAWVQLASANIQPKSEKVTVAGVEKTRDTDYRMDYAAGKIMALITGGSWVISYTKNKVALDISSLTDLIRVSMVEYPAGRYPEEMASFSTWGDWLYIISAGMESQKALTEDEYVFIFYKAYHTLPTETVDASYPDFLDEVVIKGSAAYALLSRAIDLHHKASGNADEAITALGLARALHTSVVTEFAGIDTWMGSADQALDKVADEVNAAATALSQVSTYGSGAKSAYDAVTALVSSAQSALSGAASQITSVGTDLTNADNVWASLVAYITGGAGIKGAQPFLQDGLANFINKVTLGLNAAELMGRYAEAEVSISNLWGGKAERYLVSAQTRVAAAQARVTEGSQYIAAAQARISEGDGRVSIAGAFVAEATQRLTSAATYVGEATQRLAAGGIYLQKAIRIGERIDAYIAEADRYLVLVGRDMELSEAARNRGLERRAEFWEVLDDRSQYLRKKSEVARRQYK